MGTDQITSPPTALEDAEHATLPPLPPLVIVIREVGGGHILGVVSKKTLSFKLEETDQLE